jgi:hypothetical protein
LRELGGMVTSGVGGAMDDYRAFNEVIRQQQQKNI